MTAGNKKPVRPRRPILTLLTQGVAPDYSGAAFPGLTKPVIFSVKPLSGSVKAKIGEINSQICRSINLLIEAYSRRLDGKNAVNVLSWPPVVISCTIFV
jgi:hypothetical protein